MDPILVLQNATESIPLPKPLFLLRVDYAGQRMD